MQKQILSELKELRLLISKLIGSSDLPENEQFSPQMLEKAAKEFKKLSIARENGLLKVSFTSILRRLIMAPVNSSGTNLASLIILNRVKLVFITRPIL